MEYAIINGYMILSLDLFLDDSSFSVLTRANNNFKISLKGLKENKPIIVYLQIAGADGRRSKIWHLTLDQKNRPTPTPTIWLQNRPTPTPAQNRLTPTSPYSGCSEGVRQCCEGTGLSAEIYAW